MSFPKGVDVSAYQGTNIPDGYTFAFIKGTEGVSYVNGKVVLQARSARSKKMRTGFYHYGHPGNNPVTEADFFVDTLNRDSLIDDNTALALDLETTGGKSPGEVAAWAKTWLERVTQRTGILPFVYTYLFFAEAGNCKGLGGYPLWIAHYTTPGNPTVPDPWKTWDIHQYTDNPYDQNVIFAIELWPTRKKGIEMLSGVIRNDGSQRDPIAWETGDFKGVEFFIDNSYNDDKIKAVDPVKLRVAILQDDLSWQIEHVTVGRGAKDSGTKKTRIPFKNPDKCCAMNVTREDDSTESVAFNTYAK